MKRTFFFRCLALGCAVAAASCKDAVRPDTTGSIAIKVLAPTEPAAGGPARAPAKPTGHLSSATATATSGSTTKTVNLTGGTGTSSFTGTIADLPAGSYTVIIQGFVGTQVDYFGQTTGVNVTAGSTTTATITNWGSFAPTLSAFSAPTTWSFRPTLNLTAVPNATSYIVQVDRSSAFSNPTNTTVTSTTGVSFTVSDTGTYYVRVRAANTTVPSGGTASATQTVRVVTDLRTSGDSLSTAPNLGFFATTTVTLDSLNVFPAADADWFSVSDCNGDSLTLTAQAVRLTTASPLNSVLLVYNAAGRLVNGNDDGDSTDARVAMLISTDGAYKVRVSGANNTVGHYRLRVQAKGGANNTGTTCRVVPLAVTSVGAGFLHTCAVRTNGSTDCWGNNANGQLGLGSTTTTSSATRVTGTQVLQTVTAGEFHACGRTSTGAAYCWGYNGNGQLGINSTTDQSSPTAVSGGQAFQYVGAGSRHTCGLTTGGQAYCWGLNTNGQLGNGTNTSSQIPVLVSGAFTFQSLGVGHFHACGAIATGAVYCWGLNSDGQLGTGTVTSSNVPVLVSGTGALPSLALQGVSAGGWHSCARTGAPGAAYCWGDNSEGQVGNGTFVDALTPALVTGGLTFTALAGGRYHTCGVISGGTAYCWGNNFDGQLGDGTTTTRSSPSAAVTGGYTFTSLAGGAYHTCGLLTTSGDAYCWGWNGFGQLGDGSAYDWSWPVPVSTSAAFKGVNTTEQHTCGATTGNSLYCWGSNGLGQLGDQTNTDRTTPVSVFATSGTYGVTTTGRFFSCGLTTGSVVQCWGSNFYGQLGDGTFTARSQPGPVSGTYQAVTTGAFHTCAVSANAVYCWGYNQYGQLGSGTAGSPATDRTTPGAIVGALGSYSAVSGGWYHTCALRTTNIIDCWGRNNLGQLGNGGTIDRNTPGTITAPGGVTFQAVAAGGYHTCALSTTGAAYCWGDNTSGQVGDASNTDRFSPVAVSGGLTFQSLSVGDYHSCGLTAANAVYCWGNGFSGQLGYGGFSNKNVPTAVGGLIAFSGVEAGGSQTCGYTAQGVAYCWGNNERGQLGNGTRTIRVAPAMVVTGPASAPPSLTGYPAAEWYRSGALIEPTRHRTVPAGVAPRPH